MDTLIFGLPPAVGSAAILLCALWLLLRILGWGKRFFQKGEEPNAPREEALGQNAPAAAPAAGEQERLVAVLTAVIACLWDREETGFVVRRVRRVETSPAWQRAGREEQIFSRL